MFKTYNLIKNPLKFFNYIRVPEEELNTFVINDIPNVLNNTKDFEALLKLTDVTQVKRKYYEGIEKLLEDAKRKHVKIILTILAKHIQQYFTLVGMGFNALLRLR